MNDFFVLSLALTLLDIIEGFIFKGNVNVADACRYYSHKDLGPYLLRHVFDNIRNNSHAVIVLHISIMCFLMCCNGLVFYQVFKL